MSKYITKSLTQSVISQSSISDISVVKISYSTTIRAARNTKFSGILPNNMQSVVLGGRRLDVAEFFQKKII